MCSVPADGITTTLSIHWGMIELNPAPSVCVCVSYWLQCRYGVTHTGIELHVITGARFLPNGRDSSLTLCGRICEKPKNRLLFQRLQEKSCKFMELRKKKKNRRGRAEFVNGKPVNFFSPLQLLLTFVEGSHCAEQQNNNTNNTIFPFTCDNTISFIFSFNVICLKSIWRVKLNIKWM